MSQKGEFTLRDVGTKYDSGKIRYDLLEVAFTEGVAKVLTFGAEKYPEPRNWQKVTPLEDRYYAALMRHLQAYRKGEKLDPETGLPHMYHIGCCAMFLDWGDREGVK